MNRYENIQWVIQQNLTNQDDLLRLKNGCDKAGVTYIAFDIIPFTDSLPEFDKTKASIFYGSTTMGKLLLHDVAINKGYFFSEEQFSMANYLSRWGTHMLNHGAQVTSFHDFMQQQHAPDKLFFIRPDDDSKSFAGEVKRFADLKAWYEQLKMFDNTSLSLHSPIIVSEPYQLQYEWRLWIVNKKVVAASLYRENFKLKKVRGCPPAVVAFAEARCAEYTPHELFVMDVCETGGAYYIVECNCLNSAGFYDADIEAIVGEVTEYFTSYYNPSASVSPLL